MAAVSTTRRRKQDIKRQQIIDRGLAKAQRKAERATLREQRMTQVMAVNHRWTDVYDDGEPLSIFDDLGSD